MLSHATCLFKDPPELIEPNKVMVFEGLHPIYDEKARSVLDMSIYIDIVNEVLLVKGWKALTSFK